MKPLSLSHCATTASHPRSPALSPKAIAPPPLTDRRRLPPGQPTCAGLAASDRLSQQPGCGADRRRPTRLRAASGHDEAAYPRPIECLRLADLDAPGRLDAVRAGPPVLLDVDRATLTTHHAVFDDHLSPEGLARSPMAHEPLHLISGQTAAGRLPVNHALTLAEMLAPLRDGLVPGTWTYFAASLDATPSAGFLGGRMPTSFEAWQTYIKDVAPPFPLALLQGATPGPAPDVDSIVVLSVGEGDGAPYHKHAANLYLQVHGSKKWCVFSPDEFAAFHHPTEPQPAGQLPNVDPRFEAALRRRDWEPVPNAPTPIEFVTRPGQVLYLPRHWVHATWALGDYTAAYTQHLKG